jgi:hypothetical protein
MIDIKYPDVTVELIGQDGNVFGIIGRVRRAIVAAEGNAAALEFTNAAFASDSYDEVLRLVMRTVNVG